MCVCVYIVLFSICFKLWLRLTVWSCGNTLLWNNVVPQLLKNLTIFYLCMNIKYMYMRVVGQGGLVFSTRAVWPWATLPAVTFSKIVLMVPRGIACTLAPARYSCPEVLWWIQQQEFVCITIGILWINRQKTVMIIP